MNITIFDNGISIPGNYTEHGIEYDDDCHALELALSRKSTKQYDKSSMLKEKGNGIKTIIKKINRRKQRGSINSIQKWLFKYNQPNNT